MSLQARLATVQQSSKTVKRGKHNNHERSFNASAREVHEGSGIFIVPDPHTTLAVLAARRIGPGNRRV